MCPKIFISEAQIFSREIRQTLLPKTLFIIIIILMETYLRHMLLDLNLY